MNTETLSSETLVGQVIGGKYRVERVLGQGGMGLVLLAYHEQLDQRVALKFLLPGVVSNPEIVARFLREARAAVKIHSEHVARVFDVGTHNELPYMVMEYLEGRDLATLVFERGPLPAKEAVGYVLEACEAVAEAHALGIVHRDLKPANLFLANRPSGKPVVKVLDFGISKTPVTEKERAITNATAIMGSPNYMSPEQLVAAVSVDARSDIWSMGVVLYELLSGKLPFNAASMPELVGVILQGTCVPIGAVVAALPPGLVHVVDTCLQKPRESRYQNIAELARALAPFASSRYEALVEHIEAVLGLGAPPSSTRPPVTASSGDLQISSPAVDNRTLAPTTTSFVKKSQPLKVILPIVAVALVAGGIGLFLARRSTPGPAQQSLVTPATASTTLATSVVPSATSTVNELVPPVVDTAAPQASNVVHVPSSGPHAHASAAASVSAAPSATVAPSASAPACKTVSFFDAAGNKHFKLQCQ